MAEELLTLSPGADRFGQGLARQDRRTGVHRVWTNGVDAGGTTLLSIACQKQRPWSIRLRATSSRWRRLAFRSGSGAPFASFMHLNHN